MRLFPGTLENCYRLALQITNAVKVNLGGLSILMSKDSLDSSHRNVVAIHGRRPGMTERMKPEIADARFFA